MELITSSEGKMRYQASLEKKFEETKTIESGSLDMNKMWNDVKETIIAAGEEVMGTTTIRKRNVEWFDEECREKIAKKNEARRRMSQKETRGSYEKYRELQKEAKKVCREREREREREGERERQTETQRQRQRDRDRDRQRQRETERERDRERERETERETERENIYTSNLRK